MCMLHKHFPSQFYVHATGQGSVLGVFAPMSSMAVAISFVIHNSLGLPQAFGCHACVIEAWPSVGVLQAWPAAFIGSICFMVAAPFCCTMLGCHTHLHIHTYTPVLCGVVLFVTRCCCPSCIQSAQSAIVTAIFLVKPRR